MILAAFDTMDHVQAMLLDAVLRAPAVAPRGMKTYELIASGFALSHPRCRLIHGPERRWSLPLAIGELAWHLSGSDDVEQIAYYAPIWRRFSDDGNHIRGSSYGKRIFSQDGHHETQWERLLRLLQHDPYSRRAVLNLQQDAAEALDPNSADVSCVTSCQFLIRDGALDLIVHMRSNDIIWGLPYDVFLFSMLQEMLALELGIALGRYFHFAGSLHLYERHVDLAARILDAGVVPGPAMAPMEALQEVPAFLAAERCARNGSAIGFDLSPYWRSLLEPVQQYANRRLGIPEPAEPLAWL
ncbi:MAG: thymidylate synthase [Mesorhizobium sp.]|uniref:thymidylate synthase n=1 Tax=Mesorhizobium sp. TaxID=1871066 RepID=UPI000FD2C950|nr:thymidylate synthase [Mesorhizobium sp.]RVD70232.1 thymidylate synthase [Mesorhizobium sp. M4A.F.Ca.ET.029.04.2.1]TIW36645.1 MAG: thymidylate synthase [Mesorhizobium sp.]TIW75334.1 MAG: thymidylate synthase [Mesorhizobium sp.]